MSLKLQNITVTHAATWQQKLAADLILIALQILTNPDLKYLLHFTVDDDSN
jgi:hypothetical protein